MAVVGVENVSTVDSSILMESRLPSSSSLGQHSNQGRRSSRPSFYLQIEGNSTRERIQGRLQNLSSNLTHNQADQNSLALEDLTEKENTNENAGEDAMAFQTEQEDHCSTTSEQCLDLGEAEREQGVRKIIRQWSNTGINGPSKNNSPRTQLLGESEIERVRVARESIQMACERRDISGGNLEEQVAEIGSQVEPVFEGLGLDNNEVQTRKKREIRIVCGRQAFVDLLNKNEKERKRELQCLQESCPVRNFAFRNRIQSVLRIRLMQNRGSAERNRNTTAAESELGYLRQRQTVSGLRDEFLSRLQNNVHVQENDHSGILPSSDSNVSRENETQCNSSVLAVDNERDKFDLASKYSRSGPSSICNEIVCGSEVNLQGFENQIEACLAHDVNGDGEETVNDEVTLNTDPADNESESSGSRDIEQVELEETNQAHSDAGNGEIQLHDSFSNPEMFVFVGIDCPEDSSDTHQPVIFQDASRVENTERVQLEETREEIHDRHIQLNSVDLEDPGSEDAHAWDSSTQGDERVTEDEAQEWIGGSSFSEWRDGGQPELDLEQWRDGDSDSDDPSLDNTQENESREQSQQHLVESFWHESGSLQMLSHWSPLALETGASSTERPDLYYDSDDDNAHDIELRELLSRRRVSSLLSSSFRESLDQLVQSYVERQSHTPDDWELHEMSPPPFVGHDQDHVNTNRNEDSSDVDGQTDILGSTSAVPSNRTWAWSMHQHPGTLLEMINDLRIEMAKLQQRMNHMQGMLESCVDIQLEMQRAVRQEVSAALNRTVNPSESDEAVIPISGSKWDWVRKGICCICCESKIDSLLYRCGHMCTCAKCAGVLVEGKGKCPMCLAPIVEVIRAYTLQ